MRKLFLMSLFGLSMTVAVGEKAGSVVSLVAPAYADDDSSHNSSNEHDESNNEDIAFSCPEGVSSCFRADGSEYTDVNSLSATAAGIEDDDEDDDESHESSGGSTNSLTNVQPRDFRSL